MPLFTRRKAAPGNTPAPRGGQMIPTGARRSPALLVSHAHLVDVLTRNSTSAAAIGLTVDNVSRAKVKGQRAFTDDMIDRHPLLDLMNHPVGGSISAHELLQLTALDLCYAGKSLTRIVRGGQDQYGKDGPVIALRHLAVQRTTTLVDRDDQVIGHVYWDTWGKQTILFPHQVIYTHFPHPERTWDALSPALAAVAAADTDNLAQAHNRKLLVNDAALPGYMFVEEFTPAGFDEWKAHWAANGEEGEIRVLGNKVEYTKTGATNEELQHDKIRVMSRDDIVRAFRTPSTLIDATDATFANADAALRIYCQQWIVPIIRLIFGAWTTQLGLANTGYPLIEFIPDMSDFEELQEAEDAKSTRVIAQVNAGLITRNEGRDVLGKEPAVEGGTGADGFQWSGTFAFSDPETGVPAKPEPTAFALHMNPNGTPALPGAAPAEEEPPADEPTDTGKALTAAGTTKSAPSPVGGQQLHYVAEQHASRVATWIESTLTRQGLRTVARYKAAARKSAKSPMDPNDLTHADSISSELASEYPTWLKVVMHDAGALVDGQLDGAVQWTTNQEAVTRWLASRADYMAKTLTSTTADAVGRIVAEGQSAGDGVDTIAGKLSDWFDGSADRAMTTARTETLSAANWAGIEAARQSGVVTSKTWLKTSDEACCDTCDETDGSTVGIDDEFPDGDPPEHPNCRCTVLFGTDDPSDTSDQTDS